MEEELDTYCMLRKVEKHLKLPENLYNLITSKGKNVVAVLPKDLRKIIIFPTNANLGIYCKILLKRESKLDDSFFIALREHLAEFKVKTLYTTGVCYSQKECFWEGVFEYNETFSIDKFEESCSHMMCT